ncbi:hypothetical protein CCR97_01825 [Rhodoplanes elegans]|uniref:Uncharacterized protein n=1 Tax=Rhodoplanes elegans TaxID=29408 RepID=A0A327KF42_9BRAD|nr:glycosyl hydrolase 108 family protein [Rhodoplanes elegans]MBK5956958.1 hypothetical protein [Rhodoplanes elegans]RAI33868.1 hypothetical protein CH338_21850 [Rhodoplanes elegans]
MARFETIMETVLKWEGGYSDHPADDGGPTNFGITHRVLAQWRGVAGVTRTEVRNLTRAEAIEIFRARYWNRIRGEALPPPLDLVVMDGAVNHGVENVAKMLQRILGVEDDGVIGNDTLAALALHTGSPAAIVALALKVADARKSRYVGHPDAKYFLRGWSNRLGDVMSSALRGTGSIWSFFGGTSDATSGTVPAPDDSPDTGDTGLVRPVIDDVDLQVLLMTVGLYDGDLDGLFGPRSVDGMNRYLAQRSADIAGDWSRWSPARRKIALGQFLCNDTDNDAGRVDGLFGPQTEFAFDQFNRMKLRLPREKWRDLIDQLPEPPVTVATWPRENEIQTMTSIFGTLGNGCGAVPKKRLNLPYRMKLAWDKRIVIDGFFVHALVHDSAARVLDKVYAHYKDDGVEDLGLDLFGGCTACRRKRGGSSWSMHAWSIAIDFDPDRNRLNWGRSRARLARTDAAKFWEFWEAEGWVSLGRARDFDWMHVQAARL